MKRLNLILLLSAVTVALAFVISCKETNAERLEKMCGEWVSTGGKPPFTLWEEDGKYRVTVMHRNHKGGSEAKTYLVRETEGALFIETGFAVMMDYDREKDRIRLSPGGEYRRKSDGTLKQYGHENDKGNYSGRGVPDGRCGQRPMGRTRPRQSGAGNHQHG